MNTCYQLSRCVSEIYEDLFTNEWFWRDNFFLVNSVHVFFVEYLTLLLQKAPYKVTYTKKQSYQKAFSKQSFLTSLAEKIGTKKTNLRDGASKREFVGIS